MNGLSPAIIEWARQALLSQGYAIKNRIPEKIQITPWSHVVRFATSGGSVYLKHTPKLLALEAQITQILHDQFHASVPIVITANEEFHYFLMEDAGQTLRAYLKTNFQPDFNTNNILFNPVTQQLIFIDWGEIVMSHPFFALHNFLLQAIKHHDVKESAPLYQKLQEACCKNWLDCTSKNQLLEAFSLIKKLWPIYSGLAYHRLMMAVDTQALKSIYGNRLAGYLRKLIQNSISR